MARLARLVVERPRRVVIAWALVVVATLPLGVALGDRLSYGGYEVEGSESLAARAVLERSFGGRRAQALAVVVTARDERSLAAAVRDVRVALARDPAVGAVGREQRARGRPLALIPVQLALDLGPAQRAVPRLRTTAEAAVGGDATVALLGQPAVLRAVTDVSNEDIRRAERFSLPITFALLVAAFLSVVAAGLPIAVALVTLGLTFAALSVVAAVAEVSVFVTSTAVLLGLGLSIDYSLLTVMSYRERLADAGESRAAALTAAVHDAAPTIVLSSATVALALMSLLAVGVPLVSSMALGGAVAALVAGSVAVTLAPASIRLLGDRLEALRVEPFARAAARGRVWRRLGALATRSPAIVVLVATAALLVPAAAALTVRLGTPTTGALPASEAGHDAAERVAAQLGPGALAPIEILTRDDPRDVARIAREVDGVASVGARVERGADGWSRVRVLASDPPDGEAAQATVVRLRRALATPGAPAALVGGETAELRDLVARVERRFPAVVAVAVALSLMLLVPAFRSILVPIKAVATNLLSVAATVGAVAVLFQAGGEPLPYYVPLFLFAILYGLSMDYEVFLLARIRREYLRRGDNDAAVRAGLLATGRLISAAALVMITVFLALAASRLHGFQALGVGLALGVLIDAAIVRSLLVPATVALLGERNWSFPRLTRQRATPVVPRDGRSGGG